MKSRQQSRGCRGVRRGGRAQPTRPFLVEEDLLRPSVGWKAAAGPGERRGGDSEPRSVRGKPTPSPRALQAAEQPSRSLCGTQPACSPPRSVVPRLLRPTSTSPAAWQLLSGRSSCSSAAVKQRLDAKAEREGMTLSTWLFAERKKKKRF